MLQLPVNQYSEVFTFVEKSPKLNVQQKKNVVMVQAAAQIRDQRSSVDGTRHILYLLNMAPVKGCVGFIVQEKFNFYVLKY